MNITRGLPPAPLASCPILTIGNFDGQHVGHRALLESVVENAQRLHGLPMVLSFDPHPIEVLRPGTVPKFLSDAQEKYDFFECLGIRELIILPFTQDLAALTPDQFVGQVLQKGLGVRLLLVGENFVFGQGRSGTIQDLVRLGVQANFDVQPVKPVVLNGAVVSSTRIRTCLTNGNVVEGRQCLGRPYRLTGTVIEGEKRGRQLGWPTANLRIPPHRVLPADGIYATLTEVDGSCLPSVAYIGKRPTFQNGERLLEVHIFDKTLTLYGKDISVSFIEQVREDMTFSTVDDLLKQMDQDGIQARAIVERYHTSFPQLSLANRGNA
ncbi:MAG: bifunctional riboflavin kinase/FAD synthetase [Nitrospirota bacterium]|nr:bifunctional riboflavin kinase/FAD synthetase [Nitrospirota bacterium]MDH5588367.1 bifunctional riboflavin kinase/FAD synthetase [Nitrospirota bacterium]MDH5774989.1 bifunctional riboflavin kinase/FAD synthetase [Nitrospirota bacterium]